MKAILLLLALAAPASAQSLDLLIDIERAKAGLPVQVAALPPCGGGSGQGWQPKATANSANSLPITANPLPLVKPEPPKPAVLKAPLSKPVVKQSLTTAGHYEWRTKYVRSGNCPNGRCPLVKQRYRVWVPDSTASGYYPTRGNLWVVHGSDVKSHLVREHGFNAAWVNTLSDLEARSVHSDAHDAERGDRAASSRLNKYARKR